MATAEVTIPHDPLTSPIPDEKGNVPELLLERLDAWKHACGFLEDYVEATAHLHKSLSKDYDKVLKTVNEPLREGHHFAQSNGGIASFFENIRQNTQAIANSQLETEKALTGQVLQTLKRLHTEIKNKHKELTGGAAKGAKAVEKSRGLTQKQIEHLGQNTASFESIGGKIEPAQDPYIIQRGVQHHLHKQILEENAHKKDLLDVQKNFLTFEKHVIATLAGAISQFYQVVGAQTDKTKQLYGDINANFQNVPQEFEWTNFTIRSADILVDPETPDRSLEAIKFPNQDHRSTQPLVNGLLQRKGKLMRSYDTHHYAVTPAGYFHEFDKQNDFKEHPEPELSLYLPECTIGAPPAAGEAKFIVAGKDANKNQHMTGKHDFAFKANSYDEAMKWYAIIEQYTTGKLTRQNSLASTKSPTSDPTSPVATAAASTGPQTTGETIPEEKPAEVEAATVVPAATTTTTTTDEKKPVAPPIDTKVTDKPTTQSPATKSAGATAPPDTAPASAATASAPSSAKPTSPKEKKKFGLFGRS
ncbi:hypothetical protein ABW19_dt0202985 [Dactylella cylindrospora]|nr:hypothetical protein ABW19_dt0202985 [Dactylella cylindrospora]